MQKANIKAILHIGVERFVNCAFFTRLKNIKQIVHKHFYMTLNLFLLHMSRELCAFTCCDACSFGNNLSLIGVWCTRILFSPAHFKGSASFHGCVIVLGGPLSAPLVCYHFVFFVGWRWLHAWGLPFCYL